MTSPKEVLEVLKRPTARRYVGIGAVLVLVLAVLAVTSARRGPGSGTRATKAAPLTGSADDPAGVGDAAALDDAAQGDPSTIGEGGGAAAASKPARVTGSRAVSPSQAPTVVGSVPRGVNSPGVTDTEIKIGLVYDKSAGALNTAYGFAGVGQIDQKRAWDALVAYVNKNGGVAGRRLKIVYYVTDQTDGRSVETVNQSICAAFTQDDRVFAALVGGNDTLRRCLTKAGIPNVTGGGALADSQTFKENPLLVQVNGAALDRMARFYVDGMMDFGYFKTDRDGNPGYKLGLVSYDDAVFTRTITVLKSQLSKHGVTLKDENIVQVKRFQSAAEIADEANATRAAALKFKNDGVTHVMFLSTANAFQQLTFMQSAEKQLYRPRYGLTSNDGGQAIATLLGGDARPQLKNAVSVGWFPLFDVPESDYSGDKIFPALKRCKKILTDAGETYGEGDPTRNKEAISAVVCDGIFYFKAAVEAAGTILNPQTWLEGVAKLGPIDSASSFVAATRADRHDGLGAVRDVKFFDDCGCYHYTSAVKPL